MTNSQRFGGRLLHFWPLSTMNWPEACTARIHAQGKCTCMETNTQIYTRKTSTHTHTYTYVRTHRHTHTHAQQRQAIRLHYKKRGRAEAERSRIVILVLLCLLLLHAKKALIENSKEQRQPEEAHFLQHILLSVFSWLPHRNPIDSVCESNQVRAEAREKIPVFTEVAPLFSPWKEADVTLVSVGDYWRHCNQSCLPQRLFSHPSPGCTAYVPCSYVSPWVVDAWNSERCGRGCWRHLSTAGIIRTKSQHALWKLWLISRKLCKLWASSTERNKHNDEDHDVISRWVRCFFFLVRLWHRVVSLEQMTYLVWVSVEVKILQETSGKFTKQEVVRVVDGP